MALDYPISFNTSYVYALIMGLFSSLHCIGMCGSIIGTLTLSLETNIRNNRSKLLPYVLSYNVGRISSYAVAGLLVGNFYRLFEPFDDIVGHRILQAISAIVMVSAGFYIGGWFPKFAYIEKLGVNIWSWLEPIGRKLIPVKNIRHAFLFGTVWGWLPCGLVYTALALAATSGNPMHSALTMTAFGVGTLPAVIGIGIMTNKLVNLSRMRHIRQAVGIFFIVIAFLAAFPNLYPMRLQHL